MGWVRRWWRLIVALLAIAIVAVAATWVMGRATATPTQPSIGQAQAVELARAFFVDPETHGAGARITNVVISRVGRNSADGRAVWEVEIYGDVTEAGGSGVTYMSAMWLYVDAETGIVTIFAQG
jgi:hypothetical protein